MFQCKEGHDLKRFSHIYKRNRYKCDGCSVSYSNVDNPSLHCELCQYDICNNCCNFSCKKGHILQKVNHVYRYNRYKCDKCAKTYSNATVPSLHCDLCQFDVCKTCSELNFNKQKPPHSSNPYNFYEESKSSRDKKDIQLSSYKADVYPSYPESKCEKGHVLKKFSYIYYNNRYRCNGCSKSFSNVENPSLHCGLCQFDICNVCSKLKFEKDHNLQKVNNMSEINMNRYDVGEKPKNQKLVPSGQANYNILNNYNALPNYKCEKGHTLERFNHIYANNRYKCDGCSMSYSNADNPSLHCEFCQYDICNTCCNFSCKKGHILHYVDHIYQYNRYKCDKCAKTYSNAIVPSLHCDLCQFDICMTCALPKIDGDKSFDNVGENHNELRLSEKSNNNKKPANLFLNLCRCDACNACSEFKCEKGHILKNYKKVYQLNRYKCDICAKTYSNAENPGLHCDFCQFDICNICPNSRCEKNHALKKINYLYQYNRYKCNLCSKSYNNTENPSLHCDICQFDICNHCFVFKSEKSHVLNQLGHVYNDNVNGCVLCEKSENKEYPNHYCNLLKCAFCDPLYYKCERDHIMKKLRQMANNLS